MFFYYWWNFAQPCDSKIHQRTIRDLLRIYYTYSSTTPYRISFSQRQAVIYPMAEWVFFLRCNTWLQLIRAKSIFKPSHLMLSGGREVYSQSRAKSGRNKHGYGSSGGTKHRSSGDFSSSTMHQPHHSSSRAWRSNLYESDCSSSATRYDHSRKRPLLRHTLRHR